jgi:formylglycine-generating enzyme required for sulfatase activity
VPSLVETKYLFYIWIWISLQKPVWYSVRKKLKTIASLGIHTIVLYTVVFWLAGCLPDYTNPIDPENPKALPPRPLFNEVSLVPYSDFIAYQGRFSYEYDNAAMLMVQAKHPDSASFTVVDSVFAPTQMFTYSRPLQDSAQYVFRLFGKNKYGVSAYSQAHKANVDTLDIFPPRVDVYHEGSLLTSKVIQDSVLQLQLDIWDESVLALVTVNEDTLWENKEQVQVDSKRTKLSFNDTLVSYSNQYVITVIEGSEQKKQTVDTVYVYYDYPNLLPVLDVVGVRSSKDDGTVTLQWRPAVTQQGRMMPDFVKYKLWVLNEAPDTLLLGESSVEIEGFEDTVYTPQPVQNNQAVYYVLGVQDSAGTTAFGPNAVLEWRGNRWYRDKKVLIHAGQFIDASGVQAQVSYSFYMDTTEVTQKDFTRIMNYNPSVFAGENLPVEAVNFGDAVRYCNARSKLEGLDTVYAYEEINGPALVGLQVRQVTGYRLPLEDEWELAARGGESALYYWGDSTARAIVIEYAWYSENAGPDRDTLPYAKRPGPQLVAQKVPNAFGLYDMLGNVDEWVQNYWQSPAERTTQRVDWDGPATCGAVCLQANPEYELLEEQRVVRGGNWYMPVVNITASARMPQPQSLRTRFTGIRPVLQWVGLGGAQ